MTDDIVTVKNDEEERAVPDDYVLLPKQPTDEQLKRLFESEGLKNSPMAIEWARGRYMDLLRVVTEALTQKNQPVK